MTLKELRKYLLKYNTKNFYIFYFSKTFSKSILVLL